MTVTFVSQISMLYYLLGAALSALPSSRCKDASCAEYAAQKLRMVRNSPTVISLLHLTPAITVVTVALTFENFIIHIAYTFNIACRLHIARYILHTHVL
jgi:hypothetical protein